MYSNNALNRWNSTPIENELRGRKKKETNKMGGGDFIVSGRQVPITRPLDEFWSRLFRSVMDAPLTLSLYLLSFSRLSIVSVDNVH